MNNTEFLKAIKEIIAKKENWCQSTLAKDKNDNYVDPTDPVACKFCIIGAAKKINWRNYPYNTSYFDFLKKAAEELFPSVVSFEDGGGPVYVNDEMGFDAVHKMLDEAILTSQTSDL